MRVMMLNPSFSGDAYTHNLCNALVDQGHDVELWTGPHFTSCVGHWQDVRYTAKVAFYRHTQLRAYRGGPLRPLWQSLRGLGHAASMARAVAAASGYDIVHVQFLPVPAADVLPLRAMASRAPVVYTVHNLFPHGSRRGRLISTVLQRTYSAAHHLIAHTEATVDGLITEFGITPDRISRIPHGNFAHLLPLRDASEPRSLGLDPEEPPIVLLLGVLRQNKGIDVLIEAAALLRETHVSFRVIIAGRAHTDVKALRRLADDRGLSQTVEIRTGALTEPEFAAYLDAAAIVALPYRTIDQSGVAAAALTFGRPIVASRIAGLEEYVSASGGGLLVPPDDATALAHALELLLRDPETRRLAGARAAAYARTELGWDAIATRTSEAYRLAARL